MKNQPGQLAGLFSRRSRRRVLLLREQRILQPFKNQPRGFFLIDEVIQAELPGLSRALVRNWVSGRSCREGPK